MNTTTPDPGTLVSVLEQAQTVLCVGEAKEHVVRNKVRRVPRSRVYELLNPYDAYTFRADNVRLARCVGILLGSGFFPVRGERGEVALPFLGLKNLDAYKRRVFRDFDAFERKNASAILGVLDSLIIGTRAMRGEIEGRVAKIRGEPRPEDAPSSAEEDVQDTLDRWHYRHRIGALDLREQAQNHADEIRSMLRAAPAQPSDGARP